LKPLGPSCVYRINGKSAGGWKEPARALIVMLTNLNKQVQFGALSDFFSCYDQEQKRIDCEENQVFGFESNLKSEKQNSE